MSITVRLWSKSELEAIKNRTADPKLITVFMNRSSFSWDEINVYPYDIRKCYRVSFGRWYRGEYCPPVDFYATDDASALWFVSKEYHTDAVKALYRIIYDEDGRKSERKVKIDWKGV